MSYVVVDIETDGPIPAEFSMVCFGAVLFDDRLDKTVYGRIRSISDRFVHEALTFSHLLVERDNAVTVAPLQYDEIDVGEAVPARCLRNALQRRKPERQAAGILDE